MIYFDGLFLTKAYKKKRQLLIDAFLTKGCKHTGCYNAIIFSVWAYMHFSALGFY